MTDAKIFMRKFVENTKGEEPEITKEEISKYKDFGKLMTNYQSALDHIHKKPLYKSRKGFLLILLIVLIVILISQSQKSNSDPQENRQESTE